MAKMFTIHDAKAAYYNTPFFQRNEAEAVRTFTNMVNDKSPNNLLAMSPADFTLFAVGEFNDSTGEVSGIEKTPLVNGKDVQQQQQGE